MTFLSESTLETNVTHRETINTLCTSIEKYQKKVKEGNEKNKKNLKELQVDFDAKINRLSDQFKDAEKD